MKKVRFYTNKWLDKFMVHQFLDEQAAGVDFGKKIMGDHPRLKEMINETNDSQKRKVINSYFNSYYGNHRKEIKQQLISFKKEWRKKEKNFFSVTEGFFEGFSFKNGMYVCYLSIIDCNPRFLESKSFQVFYKKSPSDAIHTIAHELLHFIFFDFVEEKLKKKLAFLSEEQLWDLSEIFNVVVLETRQYNDIIDKKMIRPYPAHKKYLPEFKKTLSQSKGIENFILQGAQILKKKKSE